MSGMLIHSIVNTPCVVSTLMLRTRISSENTNDAPRQGAGAELRAMCRKIRTILKPGARLRDGG